MPQSYQFEFLDAHVPGLATQLSDLHARDDTENHNGDRMVGKRMHSIAFLALALGLTPEHVDGVRAFMSGLLAKHHRHSEGVEPSPGR